MQACGCQSDSSSAPLPAGELVSAVLRAVDSFPSLEHDMRLQPGLCAGEAGRVFLQGYSR